MSKPPKYNEILEVIKALDAAPKPKDRKMMLNKRLQESLSDTILMVEQLGEGKLEVFYGSDKYVLTLKIVKPTKSKKGTKS